MPPSESGFPLLHATLQSLTQWLDSSDKSTRENELRYVVFSLAFLRKPLIDSLPHKTIHLVQTLSDVARYGSTRRLRPFARANHGPAGRAGPLIRRGSRTPITSEV